MFNGNLAEFPAVLKYFSTREWCRVTGIRTGDSVKISFSHRGSLIAAYVRIDPPPEKRLIVKPPKGETTLDFPSQIRSGEYAIPLGLIRTIEKLHVEKPHK